MKLTTLALLAPEVIILWAIRQWIIARSWAKSRGTALLPDSSTFNANLS
jgi:hypothetical protein